MLSYSCPYFSFSTSLRRTPKATGHTRMPPTPGIFPVPYGSAPAHTQSVITTTRPSSAAANHIVGPGVPGPGALSKGSRLGGGQLNTFPPSDRDRVSVVGMEGGMMNGQEMYGPGIGHGLHSQHQHSLGLNGNLHQHHQPVAGPSSRHGELSVRPFCTGDRHPTSS